MDHELKNLHVEFLEDLEIGQGRAAKTIENYDHYLQRFYAKQKIEKVEDITMDSVRDFRRHLNQEGLSLVTQNYHLIALRQMLKFLAKRDVAAMAPEKIGLPKLAEREIDVLYAEEVEGLLKAPEGGSLSIKRDRAILHTLFSTGLRISEMVKLDRDDIRDGYSEIAVRGKGNKVRVVFLSDEARVVLDSYIESRQDIDPALFIRHKKGAVGPKDDLRITPRSVQRLIKKYAAAAGLTKDITPHTLRHSFATDLLSNGADVRQVQQLLGHASITTTQIYTHLTDAHLQDVHMRFHRKRKVPASPTATEEEEN